MSFRTRRQKETSVKDTPAADAPGAAQLIQYPLAALSISRLNPRREVDPDGIAALAESIRVCGLMQNLAGYRGEGGNVSIVAGGRRLAALNRLMAEGAAPETVPVLVTEDEATARAWALAENAARADLNPADEVAAYAAMAKAGSGIPAIAAAFAVSENKVARRLKLATLPDSALDALREGRISLDQAGALTIARGDEQREKLLADAQRHGWTGQQLRSIAMREAVRASSDHRALFVGLEAYRAAGGGVTADLFSGEQVIEDVALLEQLFADKVAEKQQEFIDQGWAWAEFVDQRWMPWGLGQGLDRIWPEQDLAVDDQERLEELQVEAGTRKLTRKEAQELKRLETPRFTAAQRTVAGIWFCVDSEGRIAGGEGAGAFVRREDRPRAIAAGVLRAPAEADGADAEGSADGTADGAGFSAALLADLRAIRLHALHAALLENRDTALELIAYALSPESGIAQRLLEVVVHQQENIPAQRDRFSPHPDLVRDDADLCAFDDRTVDDPEAKIAAALIPALTYGFGHTNRKGEPWDLFTRTEREVMADMRAHWTPTKENFFARVTAPQLDAIYGDVFALKPSDADMKAFAKMKKGEKANLLHMLFNDDDKTRRAYRLMTDAALERIRLWQPEFD